MCGFGGILNSEYGVSKSQIQNIASKVAFRGPDSCGIKVMNEQFENEEAGPHALFFNRLAIIDLDPRSNQPFENERYLLTFNGEIYNYLELKVQLQKKGACFYTSSDTEVLFQLLCEYGLDALPRLNGMFAFFWLDKKENKFVVARDRLGIKPLYYSQTEDTFLFSSELDSIKRLLHKQVDICTEAVEMYMWLQFVPTPYTIINGIHKLEPGHFIEGTVGKAGQLHSTAYWDAYSFIQQDEESTSIGTLEDILNKALARQLQADVPLGLFLSSGVDSSLLAAMVNKYYASKHIVNFFTVRFDQNTPSDESREAADYIRGFQNSNLHCQTITINAETIQSHITHLYDYYDEPFADMAATLNWAISEKAREFVTVALSGDGADELFWGYERYNRWQKFNEISKIPGSSLVLAAAKRLPGTTLSNNLAFLLETDPVKRHFNFFLPSGMRGKLKHSITRFPMWSTKNITGIIHRPDLTAVLDIKTYLADAMLYKVDRSSMASSLEVRVPFLDNDVLEFALKLPLQKKSNSNFRNKAPLKELLSNLAPHYDLTRTKKGFNFPLEIWLKNQWKEMVLQTVSQNDFADAGLDPYPYMKLVSDFYSSRNNYFTDVWRIFNLCLWIKKSKNVG